MSLFSPRVICVDKKRAAHFDLSSSNDASLINMLRGLATEGLDDISDSTACSQRE